MSRTIQICILGDSNVGKTTLATTYKNKTFTPSEMATIGINKYIYTHKHPDNSTPVNLIVNKIII